jgi:uncharacterized membrane protein HdeD (DUF308 family)
MSQIEISVEQQIPWWVAVVRGAMTLAFGLLVIAYPALTVFTFFVFFSINILVDGLLSLFYGVSNKSSLLTIVGILSIVLFIIMSLNPKETGAAFLFFIAFWGIITGITALVEALLQDAKLFSKLLMATLGLLYIGFGIYVLRNPVSSVLLILNVIGWVNIIGGSLFILLGFANRFAGNKEITV